MERLKYLAVEPQKYIKIEEWFAVIGILKTESFKNLEKQE